MSLRLMARVVPDQVQVSADAFRTLFALPHARLVAATSLVARLPKGMVLLSVVLLLRQTSGSYAIAGVTAAAVAVGDAVSTPAQGRLLDRFSRGRILIPSAGLNVAAISAVIVLAGRGAPADVVAAIACLAGIGFPPVSGSVKAIWPQLAGQDRLPAAYALESLLQQVVFLSGPLLVAVLAAVGGPAAALACSAVLVAVGTAGFVLAAATVPSAERVPGRRAHGAWRVATVRVLVCSTLLQSLVFGALPVGLAAVTAASGFPDLAGVLQAMLTIGGILGTFGPSATADSRRYVRLVGGFAATLIPVAILSARPSAGTLFAIGACLIVAGLLLTPVAATSYVLIQKATTPAHRTEAFAWLSTGQAAGNAAGAALTGVLTGRVGAAIALGVLPVAVGLAALVARRHS
jgi:MFS family permease